MIFCGIDTSNYTTSAAICDESGRIIANLKRPLKVDAGQKGLRQSDAVFAHIKNLPDIMQELGCYINDSVAAVGVSSAPRNVPDSYMPCFLAGVASAWSFASGRNIPVFTFSHQQGHIMAAYRFSGASSAFDIKTQFLAFHVSGGTTDLLKIPSGILEGADPIGGTTDLNAGQAIDRVGLSLGIPFPCGPEMERLALSFRGKGFYRHKVSVNGTFCSFSGLENIATNLNKQGKDNSEICYFIFDYIARALMKMTLNARSIFGSLPVVFAGGVMSNSIIKNHISGLEKVFFTEPAFSSDNAAGIALLCREAYISSK